jgi:hypothetical protein
MATRCGGRAAGVLLVLAACLLGRAALAYTAAGDRIFAATNILPQIAPSDQVYGWVQSLPFAGGPAGAATRGTNIGGAFEKTITERLGIHLQQVWLRLDRAGTGALHGFTNFETELKYMPVNDHDRELLLTVAINREWPGTGAQRFGGSIGSTTPRGYFGKGLGNFDMGYLRPLAISGFFGYQLSDAAPRPDFVTTGFVVEYSIPYLQSKVQSFDLPELLRGLTPMAEFSFAIPAGRSFGARTASVMAPGLNYAGEGWELVISGLVPLSRAAGSGAGVRAQLHLSFDFLFPDTIGRPILAQR